MSAAVEIYARKEAMRRARNAAFYRDVCKDTPAAFAEWQKTVRVFVRNARAHHHEALRIMKRWQRRLV